MRVHHLNCATFCPVGQLLINGHGSPFASGRLVVHCQLIESDEGLILIDTGLGLPDVRDPSNTLPGSLWQALNRAQLREEETAIRQVQQLGFDPRDVRHIVLTHLDFDHAGGLPDFPWARVHAHAREFDGAMCRPLPRDRMRYAPRQFAHDPDWALYATHGERWFGFDAVRTLHGVGSRTEILLVPLFGHSRGHCGVAVNTPDGWLLNCGDAAFWHGELDSPKRRCPLGLRVYQNIFQYDRETRLHNQRRLRELAMTTGGEVKVFCSHDPQMMRQFAPSLATSRHLPPAHSEHFVAVGATI
jgi:glyoxylase-like metal-dependent hydrolase (beta-lactamase superfamily II)